MLLITWASSVCVHGAAQRPPPLMRMQLWFVCCAVAGSVGGSGWQGGGGVN